MKARLRVCRKCKTPYAYPGRILGTPTLSEYCGADCRTAWIEEKRGRSDRPRKVTIAVLDSLFSDVVRLRAGLRCEGCGRRFAGPDPDLHCSHFIGRAEPRTRYDFDNADAFCRECHAIYERRKPSLYRTFKQNKLGSVRYAALEARLQEPWTPRRDADKADLATSLTVERAELLKVFAHS